MKPALENTRIRLKKLRCLVSSTLLLTGAAFANSEPVAEQAMQLLQAHCVDCHNPKKAKGDLRLDSRELMLKGSADGEVVALGDRAQSGQGSIRLCVDANTTIGCQSEPVCLLESRVSGPVVFAVRLIHRTRTCACVR